MANEWLTKDSHKRAHVCWWSFVICLPHPVLYIPCFPLGLGNPGKSRRPTGQGPDDGALPLVWSGAERLVGNQLSAGLPLQEPADFHPALREVGVEEKSQASVKHSHWHRRQLAWPCWIELTASQAFVACNTTRVVPWCHRCWSKPVCRSAHAWGMILATSIEHWSNPV